MPVLGPKDLIIPLVMLLLIFGSKRLPQMGRSLGHGMREFKDGILGKEQGAKTERELPYSD
jgi:sec-independent protein translocase protein TatA